MSSKFLDKTGLQTLWAKIKSFFALKENGVYYVPGTSGYANWSANTAYAVGANVVNPSGECWTCKKAHTSGSSWSSTNWNRISAVALTGTIDGVTALYAGLKIAYRFQVLGGEGSTTLNVNNLGAKTITRGTGAFYRWTIGRNGVAILVYDGSAWRFGDYDSNDQYGATEAYCSTGAGTAAKIATSVGFNYSAMKNISFLIRFTNSNSARAQLTLKVNSQDAKNLYINGFNSSSSNYTIPAGVYWCYYDGEQFQLWTDKSIWNYKYRGDGSSLTEAFTAASSRENIASGESNATIFGKIAKWLSDLKSLAFKDAVSDSDISGTISDNHIASASTWNGKYTKPSGGIPKGDLASAVQTSLGKADSALQSESDPVFSASPAAGITSNDITTWNDALPKESWDFDPGSTSSIKAWNGLTRTAAVRIVNSPKPQDDSTSPENGRMFALTYASDDSAFMAQMAFGYTPYFRYRHNVSGTPTWTNWENVVTSDSIKKIVKDTIIGTDADTLYVLI